MKTFFWIFTIVGLLPVTAFAILHITSRVALRRELASDPVDDDGASTLITTSYIQFGDDSPPTNVNTRAWPAVVLLTGVVCCFIGLFYLIPSQPLRVLHGGYDRFEPMIRRVLSSSHEHPSLIVSAQNGNEALLVMRGESGFELSVSADSTRHDTIADLKLFFAERDIHPVNEYTSHDDHFDTDTTHLAFPLGGGSNEIADVCTHVFRDIFGVTDDEPMEFTAEH